MEKIDFSLEAGQTAVAQKHGHVLMVRFKPFDRAECDTVFCEFGILSGKSVQLTNCRRRSFVMETMPCDYAAKVGSLTLPGEHIVDIFTLPTPSWYHRLEKDALAVAKQTGALARDVGVLDALSAMIKLGHD